MPINMVWAFHVKKFTKTEVKYYANYPQHISPKQMLSCSLKRKVHFLLPYSLRCILINSLTLRLLMSYIYMELLVKPEMLMSYIYGPTFGNAETVSFYLLHNVLTLNQCREVSCVTFVCKHFAS